MAEDPLDRMDPGERLAHVLTARYGHVPVGDRLRLMDDPPEEGDEE